MKKIILSAILIVSISCFAQAPRGFYVTAGVSQSDLKSSDLISSPGIGYKAGINFNMGYHENFNYQIEMLFNHKALNFQTIGSRSKTISDEKYLSESIDAGFYFNYYILKPDEDKFFFGPQIGIACSIAGQFSTQGAFKGMFDGMFAKDSGEPSLDSLEPIDYNDQSDETRYLLPHSIIEDDFNDTPTINFDAGFGLTGGYNDFRFDLRYSKGLNNRLSGVQTKEYDENNRYTGPTLNGKLNTISFSVSYLIFKKNKK